MGVSKVRSEKPPGWRAGAFQFVRDYSNWNAIRLEADGFPK